jgi:hypothetical protein
MPRLNPKTVGKYRSQFIEIDMDEHATDRSAAGNAGSVRTFQGQGQYWS